MAISPRTAKLIRQRLFSAHGVPRYRIPEMELWEAREAAQRAVPKIPRRKPKLAPLPKQYRVR